MDDEQLIKRITIDIRLESYESFFDHAWAMKIMNATEKTSLESIVFDLCIAWRGIANTFAMPDITFRMFKAFSESYATTPEPYGKKWITAIRDNLIRRMGPNALTHTKRQSLQKALDDIYNESHAAYEANPWVADLTELWEDLRKNHEMQIAIWGSQRLAYGALYYAYEDLVKRTIRTMPGGEILSLRRAPDIAEAIKTIFSPEARDNCWSDPAIVAARNVRHALVHNGGRLTDDLRRNHPKITIVDDELHIMAPDTIDLHHMLKERVEYIVALVIPTAAGASKNPSGGAGT
jgi:hypothetical protein